jgi:hypothetical protein
MSSCEMGVMDIGRPDLELPLENQEGLHLRTVTARLVHIEMNLSIVISCSMFCQTT